MKRTLTSLLICASLSACISIPMMGGGHGKVINSPAVTIDGACVQREDDGYYDNIKIKMTNNVVEQLAWTANPRKGSCQFNLANFKQVATSPQTDLQSLLDKRCHLYVWKDTRYVTVAIANCQKVCAISDQVLPILLDPNTGGCSKATR